MAIVENRFFSEGSTREQRTIALPNGKTHLLKPNQIIVWLSITSKLPAGSFPRRETPVFPAIVDTGQNVCLAMTEEQFDYCRHPEEDGFVRFRETSVNGEKAHIFTADAWIYRQTLDMSMGQYDFSKPRRLSLREGIRVRLNPKTPTSLTRFFSAGRKRQPQLAWSQPLPLLGLEVFPVNKLGLTMDGYLRKFAISQSVDGHLQK